jgi:Protein of unknown function (DUF3168)
MIQEDLKTLLTGALPTVPVYPLIAIQGTAIPYIVYGRVVSPVENLLAGNGSPPINNTRMQIDVYSNTYASVQTTAASVRSAMQGWTVQNVSQGEQDFYEQDTRLHRVLLD